MQIKVENPIEFWTYKCKLNMFAFLYAPMVLATF